MKKTGIQIFMDNDVLIHEIRTFKKRRKSYDINSHPRD